MLNGIYCKCSSLAVNRCRINPEYFNEALCKNIKYINIDLIQAELIQNLMLLNNKQKENEKKQQKEISELKELLNYSCEYLFSEIIKKNPKTIRSGAFQNFPIKEIKIPETVKTIETNSFSGNKFLRSINIPSNVTNIQEKSFDGCKNLFEITVNPYQTKIHPNSFINCNSLRLNIMSLSNNIANIKEIQGVQL